MCTYSDARTLFDLVRRGSRISNNGPMLGYRSKQAGDNEPYVWISYEEVYFFIKKIIKDCVYTVIKLIYNLFIGY